jgi:hypothetical protein
MPQKTAAGLVAYAKAQLGKPYWYATFGQPPSLTLLDQKARQYPFPKYPSYSPVRMAKFMGQVGKFDRVHDCVGLIKGYLWSDTTNSPPKYNAKQDVCADKMRTLSNVVKDMAAMPETLGLLVFLPGHVGVYIGGGQVVEARGSDYGVVQTALKSRPWTAWGQCPWIEYGDALKPAPGLQKGDTVRVLKTGVPYYPGGVKIPAWVGTETFAVSALGVQGKAECALLAGIKSWCAVENLVKV